MAVGHPEGGSSPTYATTRVEGLLTCRRSTSSFLDLRGFHLVSRPRLDSASCSAATVISDGVIVRLSPISGGGGTSWLPSSWKLASALFSSSSAASSACAWVQGHQHVDC